MHECVFKEGGAACAAAVATCARVLMRVVGLVGSMALCSRDAHCLRWRSHLDNSAINVVSLRLDLVMVAMWGALIGLNVGIMVGTLELVPAVHGLHNLSVVIGWGYGHACWCIHPWNLLHVAKMVWSNGFFELVGICLYACLCCINNTL